MDTSKEILTELKEIAPFLGGTAIIRPPYGLPAGYFEDFAEILMYRIHLEAVQIPVPDAVQETAEISPLLAELQKINPYRVPERYFEAWKAEIPPVENIRPKLVAINTGASQDKRVSPLSRILKYAVAASLAGLLGITIYTINNRNVTDPLHGLTTVSDQDMANYLDADDVHWTPGIAPETASVEFTDNDIHTLFSNVSDAELEQYHPDLPLKNGTAN
jgi:hypothetical protein